MFTQFIIDSILHQSLSVCVRLCLSVSMCVLAFVQLSLMVLSTAYPFSFQSEHV